MSITTKRRSIFGFPLEMLVLEQGVPDLITISPEQKSYGGWRRRRGSESSDEGSKEPARRSVLSENDSAKLPVEPLKLQPCLRRNSKDLSVADVEDIYQVEERPRRRTWFDMRAPAVRVVAGDSGWWRPADLESFRVRLLKDEKLPELYKRNRINSVDAAFDYDDE